MIYVFQWCLLIAIEDFFFPFCKKIFQINYSNIPFFECITIRMVNIRIVFSSKKVNFSDFSDSTQHV